MVLPCIAFPQSRESAETYLEPSDSREISSILTGIIEQIHVKEGEYVEKGQVLLSLNSDVLEAQYEVAKTRAESQGRIMAAKAERDQQSVRYSNILKIGSNKPERDKERAILQVKEGNLIAATEDAKIARLEALRIRAELNERVHKSPIEGYVIKITKDVGEPVTINRNDPNQPNYLIRVVKLSTLKATAFLPYKAVRHIKIGDRLTVASSDFDEEWETTGEVEFVSPIIDAATGTVEVRVVIDNPDMAYKSGVPAKLVVDVPNDPSPASASR